MQRINDKINEIERFLDELNQIMPATFQKYQDIGKKAACERYVEKIVEAVTDLAFFVIKLKKLKIPEDDADAFNVLSENRIIDENLSKNMKRAKGMRNIIAHQYGNIDNKIVFDAIKKRLEKDTVEFIKSVKNAFKPEKLKKTFQNSNEKAC